MSRSSQDDVDRQIARMDSEQLPAGKHELHGPGHFAGLYAAENVAGTEFVFGATFVILGAGIWDVIIDRKSTRLNSSHVAISYAVFCLKKKKTTDDMNSEGTK